MIKFLYSFLILTGVLVIGLTMLQDPGKTSVSWFGYTYEINSSIFVVLVAYCIFFLTGIFSFLKWVMAFPERWRQKGIKNAQKKGHDYLTRGLIALHSGQTQQGKKWIDKAQKYQPHAPLFHLLMSETQQQLENREETAKHLAKLLDYPETKLFAFRGLIQEQLQYGFEEKALDKIDELYPKYAHIEWVVETRLRLLAKFQYWHKALETLQMGYRKGIYSRSQFNRTAAAIYCQMARNSHKNGLEQDAQHWAEKSVQFTQREANWRFPASFIILAQVYKKIRHNRRFQKTLYKGWGHCPHPDLQHMHHQLIAEKDPLKQIDDVKSFIKAFPQHFESQYYLAKTYFEAKIWGQVRSILDGLLRQNYQDARLYQLYAALEKAEFPDQPIEKQEEWLEKEKIGSYPLWTCQKCTTNYKSWQAVCDHCQSFNTIEWCFHKYEAQPEQVIEHEVIEKIEDKR